MPGVGGVRVAAPSSQLLDGGCRETCLCCCCCCPNAKTVGIVPGGVVPTSQEKVSQGSSHSPRCEWAYSLKMKERGVWWFFALVKVGLHHGDWT